MSERMKEIRRAIRSAIDTALLFPIRLRYPGGVIIGAHLTAPVQLHPKSQGVLMRGCRTDMPLPLIYGNTVILSGGRVMKLPERGES